MALIPGTTASDSIELVRRVGDMAVHHESKPSDAAVAAAQSMLMIPNTLGRIAAAIGEVNKTMNSLCDDLEHLVRSITPPEGYSLTTPGVRASDPPARNYFLNEAHTTHVSKAQIRRERREAKAKREAESKPARLRRKARKSGSGRSRSR